MSTSGLVPMEEPGNELLRARFAKAAALPPEQRSRDVEDFVQRSALMDAALELLRPGMAAPARADPAAVTKGLALALKAQLLFGEEGMHYQGYLRAFAAHCYPFITVSVPDPGPGEAAEPATLLDADMPTFGQVMRYGLVPWVVYDPKDCSTGFAFHPHTELLLLLKAVMTAGIYASSLARESDPPGRHRLVLGLLLRIQSVLEGDSSARLAAQLAEAQAGLPEEQRLTVGELLLLTIDKRASLATYILRAADARSDALDVAELEEAAKVPLLAPLPAGLQMPAPVLEAPAGPPFGQLAADVLACRRRLLRLDPRHPRHWLDASAVTVDAMLAGVLERDHAERLRLQKQAVELAERENRPYWLVKAAYGYCSMLGQVAAAGIQGATVEELEELAAKGDVALMHCKKYLPQRSCLPSQRRRQHEITPALGILRRATPAGEPIAPSREVYQALFRLQKEPPAVGRQPYASMRRCSSCSRPSLELRQCGACRQAHYCSRECQRADWPRHKAQCRAAAAARASTSTSSSEGRTSSSS